MLGIDGLIIGSLMLLGGTLVVVTLKEIDKAKEAEQEEKEKKQEKIKKDDLQLSELEDYSDLLK